MRVVSFQLDTSEAHCSWMSTCINVLIITVRAVSKIYENCCDGCWKGAMMLLCCSWLSCSVVRLDCTSVVCCYFMHPATCYTLAYLPIYPPTSIPTPTPIYPSQSYPPTNLLTYKSIHFPIHLFTNLVGYTLSHI